MNKQTEEQDDLLHFGMEAGARITIEHLAKEGAFDDEYIAWAINRYIKDDLKDGEGKKILD